jgi:hypothetical protein
MAKTIGQLTQATTLASGDEFVIEQSGLTKRVAASVVRGGLINADIDAAAAIAGSKLADGGIVTAKIADANITAAKLNGAQTGSAPIYGARAWANFNGTTTPPTIGASGNVASVTRNSTGNYTVTFTTAMQDASYSAIVTGSADFHTATSLASGSLVIVTSDGAFQPLNASLISVAVFR